MKNKILAMLVLLGILLGSPLSALAQSSGSASNVEQAGLIDVGANDVSHVCRAGVRNASLMCPF